MPQTALNRSLLWLFLLAAALQACAPTYDTLVLETPETRELKGWEKPYKVNGERYDPLRSHHGFAEEGLASWYGKDFHGRKTSNGEVYDMYAMTAAHKTLPLGVHVKVHNILNGREAVVRINDRGPFIKGRIIDLSYTAAKKLDVVGPGTAPVRIEALGYRVEGGDGKSVYREPASYAVESYSIQVGAFSVADNAHRLAGRLRVAHGAASVHQAWVDNTLFYRVRAGKYPTLEAAESAQARFRADGFPNSFIVGAE